MKFNSKCVKNMCVGLMLIIMVPVLNSCDEESPYSNLLTQDYSELYTHVYNRDADSILTYTEHSSEFIRSQAWRSLISTPVSDLDNFITKVQYANTEEAWMALSMKELSEPQLDRLHGLWEDRNTLRKGISLVLGKQGNQESLDLLVRNFDQIIDASYEFESALAMGRLMMEYDIPVATKRSIIKFAAVLNEPELYRAYFYGIYRSNQVVDDQESMEAIWSGYTWVDSAPIKQYILRMAFNTDAEGTLEKLPTDDISSMNVQLAVELAQQTSKVDWSTKLEDIYLKLLRHKNPVVNEVALAQIKNHSDRPVSFDSSVEELIVDNEKKEASVRLSGIMSLGDPSPHLELAGELTNGNEYLLTKKLNIEQQASSPEEFLSTLRTYINSEDRMETLFAAQSLSNFWNDFTESEKTSTLTEEVRDLIFVLLNKQDRSITYVTTPLLSSSGVIRQSDYSVIKDLLSNYQLPGDVEVYQVMGQLLMDHFQSQSSALIDSLADHGNVALNSTLRDQGWDIPEQENAPKTFRSPDWKRLGDLGQDPIWVLETSKGTIEIQMDVLSAPATISGMDSLTQAGAYNDVAFHRVVPNFVIQGGDIETGDGFGGPDYVVPTEASAKQYQRGRVGIASAGTDTEGSQYFVMHDWAPHLNARYTIIGEVTSGMDVVDNIMVGDKVEKAYWLPREVD